MPVTPCYDTRSELIGGQSPAEIHRHTVINLSSRTLNNMEKLVLAKGLNYVPTRAHTLEDLEQHGEACPGERTKLCSNTQTRAHTQHL
ncbi:hypothetical protein M514_27971 [Trichuris suis]|uniref:Uncharacterized protein n=1 Tax=Trichuris suis TaxID=68888 RepID=A0A085MRL2_9BILA|nr:hypothetical protein M514_27971 [Trichuris suis]